MALVWLGRNYSYVHYECNKKIKILTGGITFFGSAFLPGSLPVLCEVAIKRILSMHAFRKSRPHTMEDPVSGFFLPLRPKKFLFLQLLSSLCYTLEACATGCASA